MHRMAEQSKASKKSIPLDQTKVRILPVPKNHDSSNLLSLRLDACTLFMSYNDVTKSVDSI